MAKQIITAEQLGNFYGNSLGNIPKQEVTPSETNAEILPDKQQPSFMQKVKSAFTSRVSKGADVLQSNQNIGSKALQVVGQGAGAVTDIAGQVIDTATGGAIGKATEAGAKLVPSFISNLGADAIQKYQELKAKNPEAIGNLEALTNIATVIPTGIGAKTTARVTGELVGGGATKLGTKLVASGQKSSINNIKNFALNLVSPIQTKAVKEAGVARTIEKGSGIFKKSVVAPTVQELAAADEVAKIPNINPKGTFQQNYNIIKKANTEKAIALEKAVSDANVLIPRKESLARINNVVEELKSSPLVVGDAEKTAQKLIEGAKKFIAENEGSGKGILKARKEYDAWVESQKPKIFDATSENALTTANRSIRNAFNEVLDKYVPTAKQSRMEQSNLYNALENITPKAAQEANTAIGRALQRTGQILGVKNKAVQGVAAAAGIGGLGAAATFAPAVATLGGLGYVTYKTGKLIANPKVRTAIGKLLQESGHLLNPKDKRLFESMVEQTQATKDYLMGKDIPNKQGGFIKNPLAQSDNLIQEAKKYKSVEEFVKAQTDADYKMSHRPTEGVRAFDLTEKVDGEEMIPKDMYTQWYGSRGTKADLESISVLRSIKGKPEADVIIYRASPKESFNYGDWVTLSKTYAKEHAEGNNTKVYSKVVKAKDLKWAMDDVNEFGYYPENYKSQLEDIWKQANKK